MNSEFAMLPINSFLFPYGQMRLAFFEPTYIKIARESLANKQPFVLACINPNLANQSNFPSELSDIRALALQADVVPIASTVKIIDFEMEKDNILMLLLESQQRFLIRKTATRADNVRLCAGEIISNPQNVKPLSEFNFFVQILKRTYDDIKPNSSAKVDFDDAFWVLGRMAELLEVPIDLQLELIWEDDPNRALQMMLDYLIANRVEHH